MTAINVLLPPAEYLEYGVQHLIAFRPTWLMAVQLLSRPWLRYNTYHVSLENTFRPKASQTRPRTDPQFRLRIMLMRHQKGWLRHNWVFS